MTPATQKASQFAQRRSIAFDPKPFSKQPLTAVYLVFYFPFLVLAVPVYAIVLWIRLQLRADSRIPATNWSLLDFVLVYVVRHALWYWWSATQGGIRGIYHTNDWVRRNRSWTSRWLGAMPDTIKPIQLKDLTGPMRTWAQETGVPDDKQECYAVPIWWKGDRAMHMAQPNATKDEKLLVYLTGGGYLVSTCHPGIPLSHFMNHMLASFKQYPTLPKSGVSVEYRKSGQAPTPTALMDCLALYRHLVQDLQFKGENIILLGDSAGGHLVNSVVRYVRDDKTLPLPGQIILACPWTDQAGTYVDKPGSSFKLNEPYDVLKDEFYHICRDTFAMHFREPQTTLLDVYFSPCAEIGQVRWHAAHELVPESSEWEIFEGWPKTFIIACGGDVLLDQSLEMKKRLELSVRHELGKQCTMKDIEKRVKLHLIRRGSHDPFIAPTFLFAKERQQALQEISRWLHTSVSKI